MAALPPIANLQAFEAVARRRSFALAAVELHLTASAISHQIRDLERHFGRAAERCHVAQPTLSVAIRKLEDSLGIIIFERHRHGVLVTPAGEALIAQAQVVLHEAEALERMADQSRDEFAEPLRLGAIFTIGPYLFPSLIRRLRQERGILGHRRHRRMAAITGSGRSGVAA
mgnify:CR=1 FL=1